MEPSLISQFKHEIKKSKFISYAYSVNSIIEIELLILQLKQEHKKAKHICYGYKVNDFIKSYDAGEPKGIASLPIMNAINKNNLNNIVIFIVRYFGNVKLGIGGLYRAYSKSTSELIKQFTN